MAENLGYEPTEEEIVKELKDLDAIEIDPMDYEEEYEGEMWERVMNYFKKHPGLLAKIMPAPKKKARAIAEKPRLLARARLREAMS